MCPSNLSPYCIFVTPKLSSFMPFKLYFDLLKVYHLFGTKICTFIGKQKLPLRECIKCDSEEEKSLCSSFDTDTGQHLLICLVYFHESAADTNLCSAVPTLLGWTV